MWISDGPNGTPSEITGTGRRCCTEDDLHDHRRAAEQIDVQPTCAETIRFGDSRITQHDPSTIPISIAKQRQVDRRDTPWRIRESNR